MKYNRKSIKIITAPATLAVSVADMKTYLRVDGSSDDAIIQSFIEAATESVKQYIKRSIITETLEFIMDGFSSPSGDDVLLRLGSGMHTVDVDYYLGHPDELDLPFAPIQSITSIKTFDDGNNEATLTSAAYQFDATGGRVYLNQGYSWPTDLRDREAVKIRYVSGYGDTAATIPAPIAMAIKTYVGAMYDCRAACDMPKQCTQMLAPYRLLDRLAYV